MPPDQMARVISVKAVEEPAPWVDASSEFVVAAAEVLDERVVCADHAC
jgi:hypothetical protein